MVLWNSELIISMLYLKLIQNSNLGLLSRSINALRKQWLPHTWGF